METKPVLSIFLSAILLTTAAAPLSAQTTLSVVRESEGTFAVSLNNSEPVAAVQFTISSSSNISLNEPRKSGRIAGPEWTFSYNRKNDSTINVVVFSTGTEKLEIGSGSLVAFSLTVRSGSVISRLSLTRIVLSSPNAQSIATSINNFEWTASFAENPISLQQNFPNPFNPTTTIPYRLERDSRVNLSIYDMTGRMVKTIVDQSQGAGAHSASWNSTDEGGQLVPSGVYFVRLQGSNNVEARKMILTK